MPLSTSDTGHGPPGHLGAPNTPERLDSALGWSHYFADRAPPRLPTSQGACAKVQKH